MQAPDVTGFLLCAENLIENLYLFPTGMFKYSFPGKSKAFFFFNEEGFNLLKLQIQKYSSLLNFKFHVTDLIIFLIGQQPSSNYFSEDLIVLVPFTNLENSISSNILNYVYKLIIRF